MSWCSPSLRKAAVWPMLLAVAATAACDGDPPSGPTVAPGGPAMTGRIDVALFSDRSGFDVGVTIEGAGTWILQPNDELRVEQIVPGQYIVRVMLLESAQKTGLSCHVRDGTARYIVVLAGATTPVHYRIDCGTLPDRPQERGVD